MYGNHNEPTESQAACEGSIRKGKNVVFGGLSQEYQDYVKAAKLSDIRDVKLQKTNHTKG